MEKTHQGSSFIESVNLTIEKTSWKVSFPSWVILACFLCFWASFILWSSYLWANSCASWPKSYSSCILAWLKSCNHWRAGDSLILPPSEYPVLDGEGGWMRRLTVKPGQRGGVPFLSFSTEPLGNGATLSTPPAPFHKAKPPQPERRWVACIDAAGPVGIGWRKCPQRECSHLGKGNRKSLEGYRGCWWIFSLQPCLALVSFVDVG